LEKEKESFELGGKQMNWSKRRVLVTGGASFIGSTLVDRLIERAAMVR